MKAIALAFVLALLVSPAAAQCGCYGPNWTASTWGGENALPVVGPVFPSIAAYGYRNGYGYSDDIYGPRGPLTWPFTDRPAPYISRRYWGRRYW